MFHRLLIIAAMAVNGWAQAQSTHCLIPPSIPDGQLGESCKGINLARPVINDVMNDFEGERILTYDFSQFDLQENGQTVEFQGSTANSQTIVNVNSSSNSIINGKITSLGDLVIVNPSGFEFGRSASFSGQDRIVVSTADREPIEGGAEYRFSSEPGLGTISFENITLPSNVNDFLAVGEAIILSSGVKEKGGNLTLVGLAPNHKFIRMDDSSSGGKNRLVAFTDSQAASHFGDEAVGGTIRIEETAIEDNGQGADIWIGATHNIKIHDSTINTVGSIEIKVTGGNLTIGDESKLRLESRSKAAPLNQIKINVDGTAVLHSGSSIEAIMRRYLSSRYGLRLMSVNDIEEIPSQERRLVVIARFMDQLYFRVFDARGTMVLDRSELDQSIALSDLEPLRADLGPLWANEELDSETKTQIIESVISLLDQEPIILIDVDHLKIIGEGSQSSSAFDTSIAGVGVDASIQVKADSLEISNNGGIVTDINLSVERRARGAAGRIDIDADSSVKISGGLGNIDAGLRSFANQQFDGGDVSVTVNNGNLILESGGSIDTSALGRRSDFHDRTTGLAGNVNVVADQIMIDRGESARFTGIGSDTFADGVQGGSAGNIEVTAKSVRLRNGGLISTSVIPNSSDQETIGNGGNISIRVNRMEVEGEGLPPQTDSLPTTRSGIVASTRSGTSGRAGSVNIMGENGGRAESIAVSDGALISSESLGTGEGGDVTIHAERLELREGGRLSVSAKDNNAGTISLGSKLLLVRNGGQINAEAGVDGGNIVVQDGTRNVTVLFDDLPSIVANAGNEGGRVTVASDYLLGRNLENQVSAKSETSPSLDGEIRIDALIDLSQNTPGLEEELVKKEEKMESDEPSKVPDRQSTYGSTGQGGTPILPNRALPSETIWSLPNT